MGAGAFYAPAVNISILLVVATLSAVVLIKASRGGRLKCWVSIRTPVARFKARLEWTSDKSTPE